MSDEAVKLRLNKVEDEVKSISDKLDKHVSDNNKLLRNICSQLGSINEKMGYTGKAYEKLEEYKEKIEIMDRKIFELGKEIEPINDIKNYIIKVGLVFAFIAVSAAISLPKVASMLM